VSEYMYVYIYIFGPQRGNYPNNSWRGAIEHWARPSRQSRVSGYLYIYVYKHMYMAYVGCQNICIYVNIWASERHLPHSSSCGAIGHQAHPSKSRMPEYVYMRVYNVYMA